MTKISNRTRFLFGAAMGAWLNIWPQLVFPKFPASFIFAYVLVFACLWSASVGDFVEKDKG
jgi:hypothetical protein